MLRAIAFFLIAAVAIWGVYILSGIDAPVTLTWGDRIFGPYEPFEAAVAATVIAVILIVLWNILALFWRAPRALYQEAGRKRRENGYKAVSRGMVALATGDSREASRQQQKAAARLPENQPLTRMLSAQIAQINGDDASATAEFEAMAEHEETRFLGLQGLYHQARKDKDIGRALAILEEAHTVEPGKPWVLDALFRVQALSGKWESARDTLRQLERNKLTDSEQALRWRAVVDIEASRELAAADEGSQALKLAKEANKAAPGFAPAVIQYADMETQFGRVGRAERTITNAWTTGPHPALVPIFEKVTEIYSPAKQYEKFKQLASANPGHPESRIMLAREAVRIGEFAEAKEQLTPLVGQDPDARVCRLMADIELASGGDRSVARDWMARAAVAAPDPVWVCAESGAVATTWSAISPSGAFDSMEWRRPNYVPLAELPNPVDPVALLESMAEAEAIEAEVEVVEAELLPPSSTPDETVEAAIEAETDKSQQEREAARS